jgi:hypothetical protein
MIRLAWWRDRLDELGVDIDVPAEPRLQAADRILMEFTNGAILSGIAEAWMALLTPFPWGPEVAAALRERGEELFWIGSRILGCDEPDIAPRAGALWSLADAAFHCSDSMSRDFLLAEARKAVGEVPSRMPREVRPLTVLAALAASDVLQAGRRRGTAALAHRLFGTIPRG